MPACRTVTPGELARLLDEPGLLGEGGRPSSRARRRRGLPSPRARHAGRVDGLGVGGVELVQRVQRYRDHDLSGGDHLPVGVRHRGAVRVVSDRLNRRGQPEDRGGFVHQVPGARRGGGPAQRADVGGVVERGGPDPWRGAVSAADAGRPTQVLKGQLEALRLSARQVVSRMRRRRWSRSARLPVRAIAASYSVVASAPRPRRWRRSARTAWKRR